MTGIFRVLIDNNKKLVLHMLKCLIQRDDYFLNKGDQVISSHARLVAEKMGKADDQIDSAANKSNASLIPPPLAVIIQIMREESEKHHNLTRE